MNKPFSKFEEDIKSFKNFTEIVFYCATIRQWVKFMSCHHNKIIFGIFLGGLQICKNSKLQKLASRVENMVLWWVVANDTQSLKVA